MMNIKKLSPQENEFLQFTSVIDNPPKCLWYIGNLPKRRPTVAIVGSRKPTDYGKSVNISLTTELAHRDAIIVSGLAIGHDSIAHQACLDAGGTTVAVIGNGLDSIYPRRNERLAERIIESGGAIISEYSPDTPVYPSHFLERNRLISALADVVIIIEAGERSGTLNTAAHALAQGKEVMAVPGNITSPLSRGCNRLIAQGATPILSPDDVLHVLGLTKDNRGSEVANQINFDSPDAQLLYDLFHSGVNDGDQLILKSGLAPADFSMAITMLELNGYIKATGNNKYTIIC